MPTGHVKGICNDEGGEKKTKRKEERKNNQNKLAELIGGDLSEKQDRSEFP